MSFLNWMLGIAVKMPLSIHILRGKQKKIRTMHRKMKISIKVALKARKQKGPHYGSHMCFKTTMKKIFAQKCILCTCIFS